MSNFGIIKLIEWAVYCLKCYAQKAKRPPWFVYQVIAKMSLSSVLIQVAYVQVYTSNAKLCSYRQSAIISWIGKSM